VVGTTGATPLLANSPGGPFASQDLGGNGYVWITLWQNGFAGDLLALDNVQTGLIAPIVSNIQPMVVAINTAFTITANASDTTTGGSAIDSASYQIQNSTLTLNGTMQASDGSFDELNEDIKASVAGISMTGIYDLCIVAVDSNGRIGTACVPLVVYDPSAGFVTGGGWIYSNPGAYTLDTAAEGKANFGFVSKYKKGANVPDGSTEFVFSAGDLNFHSSSYQWLLVNSKTRAQFKGTGSINGAGSYDFMIWASQGSKTKTTTIPDTFRIKIWQMVDGVEDVIYDNVASINIDGGQPLGGGSILIQTK
jgi:hypothetical protein